MNILPLPSLATISKIFTYDQETGHFLWLSRLDRTPQWNGIFAGRPAFTNTNSDGYLTSTFENPDNGRRASYLAHRIAWVFITGKDPGVLIDHKNGVRADNRAANLRLATDVQNKFNRVKRTGGSSRFRGVYRHAKNDAWIAQISHAGKIHHVGTFASEIEAAKARDVAAIAVRGEFAALNFPR